jgi:hypothetical protein
MRSDGGLVTGGAVLAVVLPVAAGLRAPGYSHRRQYISELGAEGAPDGGLVSIGFVLVGLLLVAGGVVLVRSLVEPRPAVWAAAVVALALGGSYLVSGVAPCDPGCPDSSGEAEVSTAQEVHDVAGVVGYTVAVGGVVAFAFAARGSDAAPVSLAVAAVVVAAGLAAGATDGWAGALQRVVEVVLLAWLVEVVRRLTEPPVEPSLTTPVSTLGDFAARRGRTPR